MSRRKDKGRKQKKSLVLCSYQFEVQYAQIGDRENCHQFQLRQHLAKASLLHQSIRKDKKENENVMELFNCLTKFSQYNVSKNIFGDGNCAIQVLPNI